MQATEAGASTLKAIDKAKKPVLAHSTSALDSNKTKLIEKVTLQSALICRECGRWPFSEAAKRRGRTSRVAGGHLEAQPVCN
jgi:hypothetical protein